MGVDDFIARTEVALCYFGFTGDNTIGESQRGYCARGAGGYNLAGQGCQKKCLTRAHLQPAFLLLSTLCVW